MAAAAVTVNWSGVDRTCPNFRREVVHCTTAANGDWYDSTEIATILAVHISPNFVTAAADAWGATFALNRVTLNLINTVADDFTLEIYG